MQPLWLHMANKKQTTILYLSVLSESNKKHSKKFEGETMRYECEACKKCEYWNKKISRCEFDGICELPVNPEYLRREYEYIYGEY